MAVPIPGFALIGAAVGAAASIDSIQSGIVRYHPDPSHTVINMP